MGILGNLFGQSEDDSGGSDWGTRLALMGQVLMAADRGQVANIAPALADLNAQRRKYMDQAKSQKWLQSQAAAMLDKNPRLAAMLENAPLGVGESLISKYLETQFQPPDWKTFESGGDMYRVDMRDPNAKPSLLFDGPDDPFKALLRSIDPSAGQPAAPSPVPGTTAEAGAPAEAGVPMPSNSATPDMPPTGGALTPQMQMLARSFGLPPNATVEDVMALRDAALMGGEDNARAVANNIIDRYKTQQTQDQTALSNNRTAADALTKDFTTNTKSYNTIIGAGQRAVQVANDPNLGPAAKLTTLYQFMKALDPDGAVREGDVQMAEQMQAVKDQWLTWAEAQIKGGGPISEQMINDMAREMARLANDAKGRKELKRIEMVGLGRGRQIPDAMFDPTLGSENQNMAMPIGYNSSGGGIIQPTVVDGQVRGPITAQNNADDVQGPASTAPANLPRVITDADYAALDPGALYIHPNGKVHKKRGAQ